MDEFNSPDIVYETSFWDRLNWSENKPEGIPDSDVLGWSEYNRELFTRLYSSPGKMDEQAIKTIHKHLETIHNKMTELPEFRDLNNTVKGSPGLSAAATEALSKISKKLLDKLSPKPPTESDSTYEQFARRFGEQVEADNALAGMEKTALLAAEQLESDLVRAELREAIAAANAAAKEQESVAFMFGWGNQPGETLTSEQCDTARELLQRMKHNPKLRLCIEALGKMHGFMHDAMVREPDTNGQDLHDLNFGNDISKMVASEFVFLASPELKVLFVQKFLQSKLLSYELSPPTFDDGGGDITLLVDASGSMSGECHAWARAFAVACYMYCEGAGRGCDIGIFDARMRAWFTTPITPNDTLQILDIASTGGTDYDVAINKAAEHSGSMNDLVLVTDGFCEVSERSIATVQEFGRLFVVLVGGGEIGGFAKLVSAGVPVHVFDLSGMDDTKTVDVFQQLFFKRGQ